MKHLIYALARLPRLRPGSMSAYFFALICVGVATGVRWTAGVVASDIPTAYTTYLPAVLLAALVSGGGSGFLALVISGVLADFLFVPPLYQFGPRYDTEVINFLLFATSGSVVILVTLAYRRVLASLQWEQERRELLSQELSHRMRNICAVVHSIVSNTLGPTPAAHTIMRRVESILKSNDQLGDDFQACSIAEVLRAEVTQYASHRVKAPGPPLVLGKEITRLTSLLFHEFATNAAKYGALSTEHGTITVEWAESPVEVSLTWKESGGPRVTVPERMGFGLRFLERMVSTGGGSLSVTFAPDGFAALAVISKQVELKGALAHAITRAA